MAPISQPHAVEHKHLLNEDSSLGDVFHSLLGYADHPTVLQLIVWVTYVAVSVTLFIRMGRRGHHASPSGVASDANAPSIAPESNPNLST
jgi:high-affinity Fe2+/Pb2+ permease